MDKALLLQAAIQWHAAGKKVSPMAGSVVMTAGLVDTLIEARVLLQEMLNPITADFDQVRVFLEETKLLDGVVP